MVRAMNNFEHLEFLLCSFEHELRTALLCPEKTRKKEPFYLPQ